MQWHPLFAELLRPMLERFYELQTDMPVGDLPRQADIVLVRRTSNAPAPFTGLWRHLTLWNTLEYKGPTADARPQHLHDLVEVSLGVFRRLNEMRQRNRQALVEPEEMSFWYLADRPGRSFLRRTRTLLGSLADVEAGVWRGTVLGHGLYIVRGEDVAVTPDTIPVHLLGNRAPEVAVALGNVIASREDWWERYGPWLATYHPRILEELEAMQRARTKKSPMDWAPVIKIFGLDYLVKQIGLDNLIQQAGLDNLIQQAGLDKVINNLDVSALTPEQRADLMRRLQEAETAPPAPQTRRPRRKNP